jgi:hypothetical protein
MDYRAPLYNKRGARTMTISFRRKGPMLFWRIGRIGGSFFLAKNASGVAPKTRKRPAVAAAAPNTVPHTQRAVLRASDAL